MNQQQDLSGSSAVADIISLDRAALAARWVAAFGCPAPRHSQISFLRSALAWYVQVQHQAGPGSAKVGRLIKGLRRKAKKVVPIATLAPGTRLLREWQGHTHHVIVLEQGFEYSGQSYKSLTAIARLITGTAWSGPMFFGLRS